MKVKVEVEGKTDVAKIEDIFKALETNKINITKSQKLQQIEEIKELKQEIKQEIENVIGEKIHIDELIVTRAGTYLLKGKIEK